MKSKSNALVLRGGSADIKENQIDKIATRLRDELHDMIVDCGLLPSVFLWKRSVPRTIGGG